MGTKYIDLAVARCFTSGQHLVQAPGFSGIKEGDDILFGSGNFAGRVVSVLSVEENSDEHKFAVQCAEAKEPLPKINSKVTYEKFCYNDEQEEATDG